jgi:hypothetical protein
VYLAIVPALVAAAAAAVINAVFFTAYTEAIDSILQCFCEDLAGNVLRGSWFGDIGQCVGICVKVWGYGPGFGDIRHGLLGIWVKV